MIAYGPVARLEPCDDCNAETDPNDAAPSCGAHVLCVSCYNTGDLRCRECASVWREVEAETQVRRGVDWFDTLRAVPANPFPRYVEPQRPAPLDLTAAGGSFATSADMSMRECRHCRGSIHVGWSRVIHTPLATSSVTNAYHVDCVVLPERTRP